MNGTIVGLDVGATGIRAVETLTRGRALQVRRAAAVPLPPGAVINGVVREPATVTTALRTLFRKGRFTTRRVTTVIGAHPAVLIRPATVPHMAGAADQRGVVRAAAPDVLPVPVDKQYLAHHTITVRDRATEDGGTTTVADIALVAADRECVDSIVAAIEGAGLRPLSIDVTAFALTRFVAMAASGPGRLDVIAHIGAHTTSIIGVADGQPAFQRPINDFAGARITGAIQETLGCPLDTAEQFKRTAASLTGPESDRVSTVVSGWTTATVDAIKTAITEASWQSGTPLGRVWLSGGGARLATLAPQLKAQLGHDAQVALLEPATWVSKPDRLVKATDTTGQDFTVALAASNR